MRNNTYKIAIIAMLWLTLVGMAKAPGTDVPTPAMDFKATIRDDQDIQTKVHHASLDGNTFFTGTRGKGTITIAFEKVKKAMMVPSSGDTRNSDFTITLKTGEVVTISLNNDARFFGTTSFGTYRISAKNIKEVVFE